MEAPVYYNGTEYEYDITTLEPWEGAFVRNNNTQPVTVYVPPIEADGRLPRLLKRVAIAVDSEYAIRFFAHVENTTLIDSHTIIGLKNEASADRDQFDYAKAPPIGDYIRMSIFENSDHFAGNFKPVNSSGQQWELELHSNLPGTWKVEISITEDGTLPQNFVLYLLDKDYKYSLPLDGNKVTIELSKRFPVRHLRAIIGTENYAQTHSDNISLVPLEYELDQNYPNPCNPSTQIRYQLAKCSSVQLEIYNILGQKIRTLVDTEQDPGEYLIHWDGKADQGVPVAAGIYLYRLKTEDFTLTRKMTILR